jgi:hypothetical protein
MLLQAIAQSPLLDSRVWTQMIPGLIGEFSFVGQLAPAVVRTTGKWLALNWPVSASGPG